MDGLASGLKSVNLSTNMSRYVKLNVGGSLFQTTLDTLCKYDSMLRAMFSGRMEVYITYRKQRVLQQQKIGNIAQ
jgi:hypothetical protein